MGKWCLHASSFLFDRIIIKFAGNQDKHKSSIDVRFQGSGFHDPFIRFLKWDLTLAHWTQVSDHCPLGYLFCKVSVDTYSKTPTISWRQHFSSYFQNPSENSVHGTYQPALSTRSIWLRPTWSKAELTRIHMILLIMPWKSLCQYHSASIIIIINSLFSGGNSINYTIGPRQANLCLWAFRHDKL